MFTVDDLKSGYRVVLHNKSIGIFMLEGKEHRPIIYGINEKLTDKIRFYDGDDDEYAIEEVYRESLDANYHMLSDKDLLWSYSMIQQSKEMTINDIENILGYKIKIVG